MRFTEDPQAFGGSTDTELFRQLCLFKKNGMIKTT